MSLAAALAAQSKRRVSTPCLTGLILAKLDETERALLEDAMAGDMSHVAIARALAAEGHKIAQQSIGRHRKGECACEPR